MTFKIKEFREALGMTQEELSEKSTVSRTIIVGLETGAITVATTSTLLKIDNALDRDVSEIF